MSLFEKKHQNDTKGDEAANYFHRSPYYYNCAQSILKTFQNDFQVKEQQIDEYIRYGGGRAEDGYCGALYAGMQLLHEQPELRKQLEEEFVTITGSGKCADIRGKKRNLPCRKIVETAAHLLEEIQKEVCVEEG